jgi:cyclase
MRRTWILSAIVVVGLAVAGVAAQGGGGRGGGARIPPTGTIEKVKDNLYKIPGAGSNTTVFITAEGVVLVDTKLANNGDPILKQVRTVTDKPVSMIINTHQHPDHLGSNDYFPPTVEKVIHEKARNRLFGEPVIASNPAVMPTKSFANTMTIGTGKDQIDLYYFGRGHTDGDAFVVFRALRAMCVGDLMAWKMAPLIDGRLGGSILALADTLEKALRGIKNVDTVIEGHGDVNTWEGFREYARFMRAVVEGARAGTGKRTAEEVATDLKTTFPAFTREQLLPGMEYGGTPWSRAVINVTVAFEELAGRVGPVR